MANKKNINYMPEAVLNSSLIIFNNSKLLKEDRTLFNDEHKDRIYELRDKFTELDYSDSPGNQKEKKEIRDELRELSMITYYDVDPNEFAEYAMLVINRLLTSNRFNGYNYINEMKSLAIEHILKYTHSFNPLRQSKISGQYVSAFAYLTTISFNAAVATIKAHKKEEQKAKDDFLEHSKLFHRDPNNSSFEPDHSEIEETIHLSNIKNSLFEEISKLPVTEKDIAIIYPMDYRIDLEEYKNISNYLKENNMTVSLIKNIPEDQDE